MNKEEFMALVERLVREGHITPDVLPVTCRHRSGMGKPFRCIDNGTKEDLENHLRQHNPHQKEPDVRELSNGMWVAVPRSGNRAIQRRAEQLLEALGLNPADYL